MRRFQIRQLLLAQLLISRINLLPADPQRFTGTSVKLLIVLPQSRVPAPPDLTNNPATVSRRFRLSSSLRTCASFIILIIRSASLYKFYHFFQVYHKSFYFAIQNKPIQHI